MNFTKLFIVALITACFTMVAVAQDVVYSGGTFAMKHVERGLRLTLKQREQVRGIILRKASTLRLIQQNLVAERAEMLAASRAGNFDTSATQAVAIKYANVNAAAGVERAKLHTEFNAILNSEQQRRLDELRARLATAFSSQLPDVGQSR